MEKELSDSEIITDITGFDDDFTEHPLDKDDFVKRKESYFNAVSDDLDSCILTPNPQQLLVRVVPQFNISGALLYAEPKLRGIEETWIRWGRVIEVGKDLRRDFNKGDMLSFNHNFGVQYYGEWNPISSPHYDYGDEEDQIRFLRAMEVNTRWNDKFSDNEKIEYTLRGTNRKKEGIVLHEHPIYAENVKVKDSSGEIEWVHYGSIH